MSHLRAQMAELHTFGELRAPRDAAIDILPFQLEPALAAVRGDASRFLLADEVGLGKTIQAGLVLAELAQHGWCEHALIVTPPGIRQQWCDELRQRFGIRATVIDAASLAAIADSLPFDVNPWSAEPIVIASIDFLKQPDVLHALATQLWDVLIVDEAHRATIASLRYDAVHALATRSRRVLLLTATPHAGDDGAYHALCAIGKVCADDPVLLFRRTRERAGLPRSRRVHLLPVPPTADGDEMHRVLNAYLAQLWAIARDSGKQDVRLVAMVLAKRAFSSARSLATSLERRMAGLAGDLDSPAQATLPLSLEDESDEVPLTVAPAFERSEDERVILQRLIEVAQRAEKDDRKMSVLRRLVRRVHEPLIIFTEYRDTLDAIADAIGNLRHVTLLHGGQAPHERRQSLHAFVEGDADVMIATDAGSEGLNLHGNCRLVVNLELPWNPIRLEQRIGRVDRIGQARTVHAINLLADGTAERSVLANLLRRIDRIRMSEIEIAACVINNAEPAPRSAPVETFTTTIDLDARARVEAHRIAHARRLGSTRSLFPEQVAPLTVVRRPGALLIAFFRVRFVTRTGRLIEDTFVPVGMRIGSPSHRGRKEARAFAESLWTQCGAELRRHARAHAEDRAHTIGIDTRQSISRALEREHAIAGRAAAQHVRPVQPGLFDTRALKRKSAADERRAAVQHETDARARLLEGYASIGLAHDPEMVMLLLLCSPG